ncbi:hypothetical protein MKZ38_009072 [Zalerion maritima]|uniref:Uncharacterized protein n=1 Tax=Zalerion maritima TaxID=339359 RepID=A0AAD5RG73_9PEZI|nr:hypothetical protein MKZ38_009072 [Zalerion maritima]
MFSSKRQGRRRGERKGVLPPRYCEAGYDYNIPPARQSRVLPPAKAAGNTPPSQDHSQEEVGRDEAAAARVVSLGNSPTSEDEAGDGGLCGARALPRVPAFECGRPRVNGEDKDKQEALRKFQKGVLEAYQQRRLMYPFFSPGEGRALELDGGSRKSDSGSSSSGSGSDTRLFTAARDLGKGSSSRTHSAISAGRTTSAPGDMDKEELPPRDAVHDAAQMAALSKVAIENDIDTTDHSLVRVLTIRRPFPALPQELRTLRAEIDTLRVTIAGVEKELDQFLEKWPQKQVRRVGSPGERKEGPDFDSGADKMENEATDGVETLGPQTKTRRGETRAGADAGRPEPSLGEKFNDAYGAAMAGLLLVCVLGATSITLSRRGVRDLLKTAIPDGEVPWDESCAVGDGGLGVEEGDAEAWWL